MLFPFRLTPVDLLDLSKALSRRALIVGPEALFLAPS